MAVSKAKKTEILQELTAKFSRSKSVIFAANHGLTVSEIKQLRAELRKAGAEFQVAKKTLLEKASIDSGNGAISKEILDGPVGATFSYEDQVAAAKVLAKFAKDHEKLVLVAGIMDGNALNKDSVVALSKLPSREELLAKLLGSMQAPLSKFVGMGNALIGGFVRVMNAVREQKEKAGA